MPAHCTGLSLPNIKPVPIPPSLITSPYLTSPVFNNTGTPPRAITEQDDFWLQDTVPVSPGTSSPGPNGTLKQDDNKKHVQFLEPRPAAPLSPPIMISPPREPKRRASTQSLNTYPLNHPSKYHLSPNHARSIPLPPPLVPSSPGGARPPTRGLHSRMRSDSDLAFAAKASGEPHATVLSSLR